MWVTRMTTNINLSDISDEEILPFFSKLEGLTITITDRTSWDVIQMRSDLHNLLNDNGGKDDFYELKSFREKWKSTNINILSDIDCKPHIKRLAEKNDELTAMNNELMIYLHELENQVSSMKKAFATEWSLPI